MYREQLSGATSNRPQLQRLLHLLGPSDVVLVTKLDRLARSTRDLLNIIDQIDTAGAKLLDPPGVDFWA